MVLAKVIVEPLAPDRTLQFEIHAHYTRSIDAAQTPAEERRFGQVQAPGGCHRRYVFPSRSPEPRAHFISTLGHLGKFTLSLHWMNLGNQPVEVLIEDVYLLVTPSPQGEEDPQDEANRAHAAKMERLENAELLHMRSQSEVTPGSLFLLCLRPVILRSFRRWSHHSEDANPVNAISVLSFLSAVLLVSYTS